MTRTGDSGRRTRRVFLAACGTVATAGCLDTLSEEVSDDEPSRTETAGETPAVEGTLPGEGTATDEGPPADERTPGERTATPAETSSPVPDTHPFADRTAVLTIENVEEDRDRFERLLREAISFWNENHENYLSYSTTLEYRPDADEADVVVSEVTTIDECGLHDEGEFAGCATFLREGDHGALPAEVELDPAPGDWLYRTVIEHELGHVLGLDHDDEPAEIMHESLENRVPEFETRTEMLDLRDEWVTEYNDAAETLTDAFEAVDGDDFETAASEYETAQQHYVAAADLIETASEVATELSPFEPADREALDELLETERAFVESIQSVVETLRDGCEEIAGGGGYETYNEGVDAYNETIEQPLPESSEYVAAVGLAHIDTDASETE